VNDIFRHDYRLMFATLLCTYVPLYPVKWNNRRSMDEECAFYMIDPKQLVSTQTETSECKKPFSLAVDS
jgi:hypothetical protein